MVQDRGYRLRHFRREKDKSIPAFWKSQTFR